MACPGVGGAGPLPPPPLDAPLEPDPVHTGVGSAAVLPLSRGRRSSERGEESWLRELLRRKDGRTEGRKVRLPPPTTFRLSVRHPTAASSPIPARSTSRDRTASGCRSAKSPSRVASRPSGCTTPAGRKGL